MSRSAKAPDPEISHAALPEWHRPLRLYSLRRRANFRSAASVRRQASRARRMPSDRAIPPWFERDRTSGTRRCGSRSRTVPTPASTAACDSAGMSGSVAVRWRKYLLVTLADIRAWRDLRWFQSVTQTRYYLTAGLLTTKADKQGLTMTFPAPLAVFNIAHFKKLIPVRVKGANAPPLHCNSNAVNCLSRPRCRYA